MRTKLIIVALSILLFSTFAAADDLVIAAAADLHFALQEIANKFEKETGNKVTISFGSSGNIFNLIQNGAPYDIFFSADIDYPRKLEAAGKTEPGSLYQYASGKLVIWVPASSQLDLKQGLTVLLDPQVKKIAIANPLHAPYGRAAMAAMKNAGIYDRVKDRFVTGENISQTAEFVQTGNADVGMVALSLALSPTMKSKGRFVEVPAGSYPPIDQGAVILNSSRNKPLAQKFLAFMKRQESAEVLRQYGFAIPANTAK